MKHIKSMIVTALFSFAISHNALAIDQLKNKEMIAATGFVASQDSGKQPTTTLQKNRRVEMTLQK